MVELRQPNPEISKKPKNIGGSIMNKYKTWRSVVVDDLKNNSDESDGYIETALEEYAKDGNTEALLLALRTIAEAQGGISKLAKNANLNKQSLYKALSVKGNPRLSTIGTILKVLGYSLSVRKFQKAA
jgi:probable addiction module antidote protein